MLQRQRPKIHSNLNIFPYMVTEAGNEHRYHRYAAANDNCVSALLYSHIICLLFLFPVTAKDAPYLCDTRLRSHHFPSEDKASKACPLSLEKHHFVKPGIVHKWRRQRNFLTNQKQSKRQKEIYNLIDSLRKEKVMLKCQYANGAKCRKVL